MTSTGNQALADILDRQAARTEGEQLLNAIVDFGVYVPVDANGSVMFVGMEGSGPSLPGYTSEECCRERLPQAAGAVHCDAARLLDIEQQTKVATLSVFSPGGYAGVPMELLHQILQQRGQRLPEDRTLTLRWSTHPRAVALRDALRDRLLDFPGVHAVWIGHARWHETGVEQLMVHMAVGAEAPEGSADRLMKSLLAQLPASGDADDADLAIALRVLDPVAEADAISQLDAMGLDTVRVDQSTRRVEVISQEYDRG
ncbi:hypothetical protein [Streptomyces sp. Rer75]|uniref:hypothetical protein n=1 Tax=unclassified Streptomyces TaxID=2593676 RepID=UPI0015D084EF|nr:hypothetical protein [Streptomyces sp. Rer75]QLH26107.1 hypothetical protein HYQ63_40440 [Streptomyces sp. Rer75]